MTEAERVTKGPGLLRRMTACALNLCGGRIERDAAGRVNWRCGRCGRWSAPVPSLEERRVIDRILEGQAK